jgi:hypothetical protein
METNESPNNNNEWPRLDKATGFTFCEACWNAGNLAHYCAGGRCQCLKRHGPRKARKGAAPSRKVA